MVRMLTSMLALACMAGAAHAQVAPAPIEAYGALPAFESPDLSPSGDRLAYIAVVGEERSLIINDLNDMSLIGGVRAGEVKVRGLGFVGEDHVFIYSTATQSAPSLGIGRTEFADASIYEISTRNVAMALRNTEGVLPKVNGAPIIRTIRDEPAMIVAGVGRAGAGYYRINLRTGRGDEHYPQSRNGSLPVLDQNGEPVARAQYENKVWILQRRLNGFWRDVWRTPAEIDVPSIAALGPTTDSVVLSGAIEGRRDGYYLMDLASGQISDLPFAGEVISLMTHPTTRLLIGAAIRNDDETLDWEITDPAANRTWRSILAAFEDKRPRVVSWSDDMRQSIVYTESDKDSGTYHLVDLDRRTAEIIGEAYPQITPERVGQVRIISYAAADGMNIPGYLTLPPGVTDPKGLPLVVLAHGGPASRDNYGFDWWAQAMASRGYAVLQPNFRGSDGLGTAHLEAGYGQWGRKMQTDLSDGVRWLASEGIIDPARVCIVGASYGGYAAMAGPTLDTGVYRCAVSVAGVSDLRRMVEWEADTSGQRDAHAVRYWNRFMGADRLGDRDLDPISPAKQAARADAPILLLHGRDDTVVPFEQSRIFADALRAAGKPYEFIELSGEDHWLSRAATRTRMLNETVRFLQANNPAN